MAQTGGSSALTQPANPNAATRAVGGQLHQHHVVAAGQEVVLNETLNLLRNFKLAPERK